MRPLPWLALLLALAAAFLTWVGCLGFWPQQAPRATFPVPWQDKPWLSCHALEFSPDSSLLAADLIICGGFSTPPPDGPIPRPCVLRVDGAQPVAWPLERKCAFSPKGDVFALYSKDKLEVFDTRTGTQVADLSDKWGKD